jgi:hypothetical protein
MRRHSSPRVLVFLFNFLRLAILKQVPLPITGGTELDDWPGGIGQKYETLRSMLPPTLKALGFSAEEIAARQFMSLDVDGIGIWRRTGDDGKLLSVVCFATPEVLGALQVFVLVFFRDVCVLCYA